MSGAYADPAIAIQEAHRLRAFLRDDVVQRALKALEDDAYGRFKAAETDQERLAAWAAARAVEELKASLEGVVATGDLAERENPDLQ